MEEGTFERVKDFLDTKTGKLSAVGLLCALALAIAGLAYISLTGASSSSVPPVKATLASVPSTQTTQAPGLEEEPIDVETYTQADFRDPFKPVEESATAGGIPGHASPTSRGAQTTTPTATGSAASTATPEATAAPSGAQTAPAPGTIKLTSVSSSGGAKTATLQMGSATYSVKTGDRVGNTSYQVSAITDSSVTLLFGNDTLILSLNSASPK